MPITKTSLTAATAGTRLDVFASAETGLTRSAVAKLLSEGALLVNGRVENKNYKLRVGDVVELTLPEPEPDDARPQNIPLDVVYEDNDIIVINKPSGMVVHPAAGNPDGTLVNALLYHCRDSLSGIGGVSRPGIVHRIDKDTSGLIAVAKNDAAHLSLAEQLKTHSMRRVYYAIVVGSFKEDSGVVDAPIGRCPTDRKKMAVIRDPEKTSRNAVTHWTVVERYSGFSLVRCELETGRTHQIRVHMSFKGHPLMGDTVYGGGHTRFEKENASLISGQCLHAAALHLTHPVSGEDMVFTAPLPSAFERLLEKLRNKG